MKLILYIILTLSLIQAECIDIYVEPFGDNENKGTIDSPLASIQGARDLIRALKLKGDLQEPVNVLIGPGTYLMDATLNFDIQDSGSEEFPITYKSRTSEKPVFIGGLIINEWEEIEDGLWRADIPQVRKGLYFEQLYVNGQRAVRAKSPNRGFYHLESVQETVINKGEGRTPEFAVQSLKIPTEAANEIGSFREVDYQDAISVLYHKWDNTRKRISSFNADSSQMYFTGRGMKPWNKLDEKTTFYLENYKAGLDSAGEWFLERNGDLYYKPLPGEDQNKTSAVIPILDQLITVNGEDENERVSHLRFENIEFQGTGYRMPLFGNEPEQAAASVDAAIMLNYVNDIKLINCNITHTGNSAIWFKEGCINSSMEQCFLSDLGAGGVKIGAIRKKDENTLTHDLTIDNNIIKSGGYVFPCAVGVTIFQASDIEVTHNEIANFRYSGVSVGWNWGYDHSPSKRNTIAFNHIHHLGWGELSDMGGVYCLGKSEGTSVNNNVIHHVYSYSYGGWGLYTDEGSTGITMENNLVYQCKNSGFHQHYGEENYIRNNIFAGSIRGQLQATRVEDHISFYFTNNIVWYNTGELLVSRWDKIKLVSDYNCYWDDREGRTVSFGEMSFNEWQSKGMDAHSIVANPKIDPDQGIYWPMNKSVLRKIDFKPFDPGKAGVYGSEAWKKKAQLDPQIEKEFEEMILIKEQEGNR